MIRAINLCFGGTHHSPFVGSCGSVPERCLLRCHASTPHYRWLDVCVYLLLENVGVGEKNKKKADYIVCNRYVNYRIRGWLSSFFHKMPVYFGLVVIHYIFVPVIFSYLPQRLLYRRDFSCERGQFVLTNKWMWILLLNFRKH